MFLFLVFLMILNDKNITLFPCLTIFNTFNADGINVVRRHADFLFFYTIS